MIFVDTNYFVRLLLGEEGLQGNKVRELFNRASRGEIELASSTIVFFEVYWVMGKFYSVTKNQLANILRKILTISEVKFEDRDILTTAVEAMEGMAWDLEDAYNLAWARMSEAQDFASFDKKMQKAWAKVKGQR